MGAIWTSRIRTRQPQGAVGVNWGSPLARNLKIAWSGRFPTWNAATNKASIELINAPPQVSTPYGVGVQLNGSNQSVNLNAKLGSAAGSWYAIAASGASLIGSGGILSQSIDDAGSGIAVGSYQGYVKAGGSQAYLFDSGSTESIKAVGGTWNGSATKAFNLGALKDTGGAGSPTDPFGNYFAHLGAFHYSGGRLFHWAGTPVVFFYFDRALSDAEMAHVHSNPWQLFAPQRTARIYSFPTGGATDYPVTASDALTLADSALQSFSATGVAADALTLADSASNVASLGAAGSDALSLADSASNVAALSATASDALPLADTLNATASGDYTATGSDALTLADSAANAAALGATGTDALTLADAASNTAALGATAADALTLADTLNASASGDYVVVATDALSLSDSVVAAYAAICIATDALSLADATSAAMAGQYAATATDALTLADAVSNAAALGVSISEALTLAALVSAMLTGNTALTGTRGGYGVQMQLAARRAQIQTGRRRN